MSQNVDRGDFPPLCLPPNFHAEFSQIDSGQENPGFLAADLDVYIEFRALFRRDFYVVVIGYWRVSKLARSPPVEIVWLERTNFATGTFE